MALLTYADVAARAYGRMHDERRKLEREHQQDAVRDALLQLSKDAPREVMLSDDECPVGNGTSENALPTTWITGLSAPLGLQVPIDARPLSPGATWYIDEARGLIVTVGWTIGEDEPYRLLHTTTHLLEGLDDPDPDAEPPERNVTSVDGVLAGALIDLATANMAAQLAAVFANAMTKALPTGDSVNYGQKVTDYRDLEKLWWQRYREKVPGAAREGEGGGGVVNPQLYRERVSWQEEVALNQAPNRGVSNGGPLFVNRGL